MISDKLQEDLLSHINSTPTLIDLFYEMGLMPEQLEPGSQEEGFMYGIAYTHRHLQPLLSLVEDPDDPGTAQTTDSSL